MKYKIPIPIYNKHKQIKQLTRNTYWLNDGLYKGSHNIDNLNTFDLKLQLLRLLYVFSSFSPLFHVRLQGLIVGPFPLAI